jgi:hypothetical protein
VVSQPAQERLAHLPPGGVLDMHDPQVAGRAKAGHAPLFLIGK